MFITKLIHHNSNPLLPIRKILGFNGVLKDELISDHTHYEDIFLVLVKISDKEINPFLYELYKKITCDDWMVELVKYT